MLRNWLNFLLMAAAAALLLVATGVSAATAMVPDDNSMAMQSPCGAMDMGGGKTAVPSAKNHCAVGCMMSPSASGGYTNTVALPTLAPCCGDATTLRSAPLTLEPPPPKR